MNKKEERRQVKRYPVAGRESEDIYIELDIDGPVRAEVTNINMSGIGFEIESGDESLINEISGRAEFFVKLYLPGLIIFSEMKKVWNTIAQSNGSRLLKAGMAFSVLSPEDRLTLADFIDKFRKRI